MRGINHIIRQVLLLFNFKSSQSYWEQRYRLKGTSGSGSYGDLARFKAEVLNEFVRRHNVKTVIEFGCGDGAQLSLAEYPDYLGLDVSKKAVELCSARFKGDTNKSFFQYDPSSAPNIAKYLDADLVLSLDVIYHLVEDNIYEKYLHDIFSTAHRFVIIYSSDEDKRTRFSHVRHRKFTLGVKDKFPTFQLNETIENQFPDQSPCSFYIYEKMD